jgi:membrane-associated phospholipid phosphatase
VVYTQMHYAVDVLAGLLVAGVIGAIAVATSPDT